jgi:two-component system, chemotaxis family, protein-glutamate methylesterase/glutaminase
MIKVLIVEDSPVIQNYLEYILSSEPDMTVIGKAGNGEEAIEFLKHQIPDVITMDIHMPRMDGFEATRHIMETTPVPIVVVSGSTDPLEVSVSFKAIEAGAVGMTSRPRGPGHPDFDTEARKLVQLVRLLSEVKVVRRYPDRSIKNDFHPESPVLKSFDVPVQAADIRIVAIGTSTGGPPVLKTIMELLPADFPVPVLIVQHIARGFVQGLAEWLSLYSKIPVRVGRHGEKVQPGCTYIAPDLVHMEISSEGMLLMRNGEPKNGLCPSVSRLFRSVSEVYGKHAAGVLLTGMGKDGAEELLLIRKSGGVTIAQDEASSVVHGMPGEAIKLNGAMYVLPPEMIAQALKESIIHKR